MDKSAAILADLAFARLGKENATNRLQNETWLSNFARGNEAGCTTTPQKNGKINEKDLSKN